MVAVNLKLRQDKVVAYFEVLSKSLFLVSAENHTALQSLGRKAAVGWATGVPTAVT
jgi:hypothetical protein